MHVDHRNGVCVFGTRWNTSLVGGELRLVESYGCWKVTVVGELRLWMNYDL